jgi:signal transduction histidine kinase/CheY-like chemotaxis protein
MDTDSTSRVGLCAEWGRGLIGLDRLWPPGPPDPLLPADRASSESKWVARLVGTGSLLTLVYQVAFLILDRGFLSARRPAALILHLLNIALFLLAVAMAADVGPWMRRNWKKVALAFSVGMIGSSAAIAVLTRHTQPLFVALVLFLAGTGPFLSWGEGLQTLLSIAAITSFAIATSLAPDRTYDSYQWVGVLIAAAIGLFSSALEKRLRRARRRAEEELLKSREVLLFQERMRVAGQLAAGIAHDLNNTLNVMKLRLSGLTDDEELLARHGASLQAIDRAINDAAATVARVRELGRGREDHRAEAARVAEVVSQALDLARTTIQGKPLASGAPATEIEADLAPELPPVRGSESELRQVFLNLLLNANDAMAHRGKIRIEARRENEMIAVRISDQGGGIADEHLSRIFEPFFTTKGESGTGLGLAIARKTIEELGGSISAANAPGGGAVFSLKLPLANSAAPESDAAPARSPLGRCRFLIIDDNAENLAALKDKLALRGHFADTASSGSEGIEKLRSPARYDVVLCDLGMPGMNGWEVARKASKVAPHTRFYIVTGWTHRIAGQAPADLALAGVLAKPINPEDIDRIAAELEGPRAA